MVSLAVGEWWSKKSREKNPPPPLDVPRDGAWKEVAKTPVVLPGWSAHFRVEKWDASKDVPYRLRHGEKATFEGLIRRDPIDKDEIVVANMSCNSSRTTGQRPEILENLQLQNPDLPGLQLLGARQEKFLREWGRDWTGAEMKAVLSQTAFCGAVHMHGGREQRLLADLDCNGWPQTPRNRALESIRRAWAVHLCGDQHLAVVVENGIREFGDDPERLTTVREYHAALTAAGVPHRYFEVEGLAHNQQRMIDGRKATWFDFHLESLRRAGIPLHTLDRR